MSLSITIRYLTVALLVFGSSASSAQTCDEVEPSDIGEYDFALPDYIGDLEYYDEQLHDDPRLGYAITYLDEGTRLDIFFYDYGIFDIPDGIDSKVLREHYEEVKAQLKESGAYSRVTLQSERQVSLGSSEIPALEAHYLLQAGQSKLLSFIFLTARYGEFIKIRLSLPVEKRSEAAKVVDAVFSALGKALCATESSERADNATVLAAIDRMLGAKSVEDALDEVEAVLAYAAYEEAPIEIVIDENFFQFTDNMSDDSFFMAFYFAGAIKFDLENPSASRDPVADTLSAIRATVTGLRIYQSVDPSFEHPFIEDLARLDKAGGLEEFVRSKH